MADKNSHTMLTEGDKYYAEGAPKGGGVIPITNEPWRDEMKAMREADLQRQTEHEQVVRELLALAVDAPDGFATLLYSYPWLAAYLHPVFVKANGDAEG